MTTLKKQYIISLFLLICHTALYAQNGIRIEVETKRDMMNDQLQNKRKGLTQEQKDEIEHRIEEQVKAQRKRIQKNISNTEELISSYNKEATAERMKKKTAEEAKRKETQITAERNYEIKNKETYRQRDAEIESRQIMSEQNHWAADTEDMLRSMNKHKTYTTAKVNMKPATKNNSNMNGKVFINKAKEPINPKKDWTLEKYLEQYEKDKGANFTNEDFERFNSLLLQEIEKQD